MFPNEVYTIVRAAAEKFEMDISKAALKAEKQIRLLPEFPEIMDSLIKQAILDLVYSARHKMTCSIKRQTNQYGQPSKVSSAGSEAVGEASFSAYSFCVAGTVLGAVLGEDLPSIAEQERAISSGHAYNARLLETLIPLVPKKKRVKDVISEQKLRTIMIRLSNDMGKEAA